MAGRETASRALFTDDKLHLNDYLVDGWMEQSGLLLMISNKLPLYGQQENR